MLKRKSAYLQSERKNIYNHRSFKKDVIIEIKESKMKNKTFNY
jgi:hypothetical protein